METLGERKDSVHVTVEEGSGPPGRPGAGLEPGGEHTAGTGATWRRGHLMVAAADNDVAQSCSLSSQAGRRGGLLKEVEGT